MHQLINSFPRQVATPQRTTMKDKNSFYRLVNQYNGLKNIYFSIYNTDNDGKFSDINLDLIFFDFDEVDAIEDVKKLSNYLMEKNIRHLLMFSGKKGFHVYIFTKNGHKLKYPKEALTNAHDFFIKELKLKMDMHIRGDIARIARIPNSLHIGGRKFCIPIKREDLIQGMDYIRNKANYQQWDFNYYGMENFDISKYDYNNINSEHTYIPEGSYTFSDDDEIINKFLPCVQCWLLDKKNELTGTKLGNYAARYFFVVYCKVNGWPKSFCDEMAKKYFGAVKRTDGLKDNYVHFKKFKVLDYGWKDGKIFPDCSSLYEKGLCLGKCQHYKERGSPLYD